MTTTRGFSKTIKHEDDEQQQKKQEQLGLKQPNKHIIYEVTRGIRSPQTQLVYQRAFNRFLDHIQIHYLQVLLDFSPKVIKQMIIDYVIFLRDDKRLIAGTIKVHLAAILHFFQINNDDFNLTIRTFRFHLPSDDSVNDDRPYTLEEIAQVLEKGCSDIRSKVVILLLCSSGMRIGALPGLQICDLTEVKFAGVNLFKVQVYARTRDKYYTFTTPETTKAINDYLGFRRRCGEQLKDKSPLIREQFNRDNPFTINSPKFVTKKAIEYLIDKTLRTADMRKIKEVHMSHGFRKFFVSQCESSPMKSVHVSMLAGHDTGIKKSYYIPKDAVVLEDYMTHAADALTIDPTQRLQKQVEKLESERSEELKQLKAQLMEYKKFAEKTAAEINNLKAINGLERYETRKFFVEPNFSNIVNAINELRAKNGQEPVAIITPQEAVEKAERIRYQTRYIKETKECPPCLGPNC